MKIEIKRELKNEKRDRKYTFLAASLIPILIRFNLDRKIYFKK
jgi:hypothetical protein